MDEGVAVRAKNESGIWNSLSPQEKAFLRCFWTVWGMLYIGTPAAIVAAIALAIAKR